MPWPCRKRAQREFRSEIRAMNSHAVDDAKRKTSMLTQPARRLTNTTGLRPTRSEIWPKKSSAATLPMT